MRMVTTICIALLLAAPPVQARDEVPPELARCLDDQAIAIARIDLAKLELNAIFQRIAPLTGDDRMKNEIQPVGIATTAALKEAGVRVIYMVANFNDPFIFLPVEANANPDKILELFKTTMGLHEFTAMKHGAGILIAIPASHERLKAIKSVNRPDLAAALAAGNGAAIHIAIVPNADARRVVEESMPNLPKDVGGGSIQTVTRGITWATLTVATSPKLDAKIVIQARDTSAAKQLDDLAQTGLKTAIREADAGAKIAKLISTDVEKDRVILRINEQLLDRELPSLANRAREAASRSQSMNNLKQIALAFHNYHDPNEGLPTDSFDKNGKPLLSWRVHILPYLDQNALYKQFKLDEPWDSAHNSKLVAQIPKVFVAPLQKSAAGTTTYLGASGDGYLFNPKAAGKKIKFRDITDGTSNTIMVVEAADDTAVAWTKPADWQPDPKDPVKKLIGHYPNGFAAAFCDGSVRYINKSIAAKDLLSLLTIAGGEVIEKIP